MKRDKKKEGFIHSITEIKTLETHFSRMAAKGWMIEKIKPNFEFVYKKIEPCELRFSVNLHPNLSSFEYPDNKDVQEYRNICEESGWIFASSYKQMQVFYTEMTNDKVIPIDTDDKIEAQIMLKSCKKEMRIFGILSIFFLLSSLINLIEGYELLFSNADICHYLFDIILTLSFLCICGYLFVRYVKIVKSINKRAAYTNCKIQDSKNTKFIIHNNFNDFNDSSFFGIYIRRRIWRGYKGININCGACVWNNVDNIHYREDD